MIQWFQLEIRRWPVEVGVPDQRAPFFNPFGQRVFGGALRYNFFSVIRGAFLQVVDSWSSSHMEHTLFFIEHAHGWMPYLLKIGKPTFWEPVLFYFGHLWTKYLFMK